MFLSKHATKPEMPPAQDLGEKKKSLSEGITNLYHVIYVFPSIWLSSVNLLRLTTVTCSPIYSHFLLL